MKTIDSFNFNEKAALIRVDFNVPLNQNFTIADTTRIESAKPSIIKVLEDGGSVVLMSHLGRPAGKFNEDFSMKHIVEKVSDILGVDVILANDIIGNDAKGKYKNLDFGQVLLLENLRFRPEETIGEENFAKELASFGDIYINDAFGTAHRKHASTSVVAKYFNENKCFGFLMKKELDAINKILEEGEKPVTGILGGAKVSSKITIIDNILPTVDHLIIAGGMAFTFIKALGGDVGNSIVEDDKIELALSILKKAKEQNVEIHLPMDSMIADNFNNNANQKLCDTNNIPTQWQGLDIGKESIQYFSNIILNSKTILWNGPMGVFEFENFSKGTQEIGKAIGIATKNGAFSLVGGGDSVAAVKQFGMEKLVSYVSTGGGAMLESLEGKILPGVSAIL